MHITGKKRKRKKQQLSPPLPPRMEPLMSLGGNAPNLFIYFNKYISIYVVFFF